MTVQQLIGSRSEVFSVRDEMTVHDAARYLRDRQVRSAGVIDGGGKLVRVVSQSAYRGMLSVSDLLKVIASDEKARADMLEQFVFERPSV
jgi:CBS domain-containing protein